MKRFWDREGTHQQANAASPCCLEQSEGSAGKAGIPSTTAGSRWEAEAAGGSRGAAAEGGCNRLVGHVSCPGAGAGPTSSG